MISMIIEKWMYVVILIVMIAVIVLMLYGKSEDGDDTSD